MGTVLFRGVGNRSETDYEDFRDFELNETQAMYPMVCEFVALIEKQIIF